MNKRTRIIAIAFGLLAVYGLIEQVVYPVWIEPALTIDERIAERREELDRLEKLDQQVELAKRQYLELASRLGSMEVGRIETDLRDRINALIEKHKLENMQVSRTKPTRVGKTELKRMRVVVKADASLESAVAFLRDAAQLPHLIRVENVKMSPTRSRTKGGPKHQVSLTVPFEVRILPQHKIPKRIDDSMLNQPEKLVRHEDRNFAPIWEGKPFWEYVPPIPLRVQAGRPLQVKVGKRASLSASASGGDKNYSYLWSPATRLKTPDRSKTGVDTSEPFSETYTITVTDGTGKSATASVSVTVAAERVAEKPKPGPLRVSVGRSVTVDVGQRASIKATPSGGKPPYRIAWSPSDRLRSATQASTDVDTKQPFVQTYEVTVTDAEGKTVTESVRVEAKRARWKNAKYLQLRMALMRSKGDMRLHELMVYNNKKKQEEYYAVGDDFDGGELVFVHPTGGLVRRSDGYFIYPIGGWVDQDVIASDDVAAEHPWLVQAAQLDQARREKESGVKTETSNKQSGAEVPETDAPTKDATQPTRQREKKAAAVPPDRTRNNSRGDEASANRDKKSPTATKSKSAVKRPRIPNRGTHRTASKKANRKQKGK